MNNLIELKYYLDFNQSGGSKLADFIPYSDHYKMSEEEKLKTGYTTGSSATAASKAALLSIIKQQKIEEIEITLPKKTTIKIPVNSCQFEKNN